MTTSIHAYQILYCLVNGTIEDFKSRILCRREVMSQNLFRLVSLLGKSITNRSTRHHGVDYRSHLVVTGSSDERLLMGSSVIFISECIFKHPSQSLGFLSWLKLVTGHCYHATSPQYLLGTCKKLWSLTRVV